MQHLPHSLLTRGLITTKDIDEEQAACRPLIQLPCTLRITAELAWHKLAPILQAADLPDLLATSTSALKTGPVSCHILGELWYYAIQLESVCPEHMKHLTIWFCMSDSLLL